MNTWPAAGVVFGVLWVFVRGPPAAADAILGQFLLGIAVGFPVAYLFRRLYAETFPLRRSLRVVPYTVLYLLTFVRELIVANLDVTYRVLAPSMPIDPEVILVPLRVETDLGVTLIANSITITPGTLTLDHDPDANALYVHTIDGRDPSSVVEPIRTWENYALVIFDEERSPADPPPEITVHPPEERPPEPKRDRGHLAEIPDRDASLEEGDDLPDEETDDSSDEELGDSSGGDRDGR